MTKPFQTSPIDHLIRTVADSLDAHTSALLIREAGNRLRLMSCQSLSDAIIMQAVVEADQGPIGWVMREQRPLNIARFKRDSRTVGIYARDVNIKSFMAVPLPKGAGVLMADSKTRLKFTDKHLNILSSFGKCAYYLLGTINQQAVNEMLIRLLGWEACSSKRFKDALKELMDILGFKVCLVLRRVHGKNFFKVESIVGDVPKGFADQVIGKRFPLDKGVCGWIFKHSKDILLRRFRSHPERSFLIEPNEEIDVKDTVWGLFYPAVTKGVFRLDHVLVFGGQADPELWPSELPEILKARIERIAPWR